MTFQWPAPISLVADVIAIVGLPTLIISTIQLYRESKKERAEAKKALEEAQRRRGVSEDCVSFYDVDKKCAINLVPFRQLWAIPRVGDHVHLPGETDGGENYGGGKYEVVDVDFHYRVDSKAHPFIPATTSVIEIMVRLIAPYS
jgi:hypothetical protein